MDRANRHHNSQNSMRLNYGQDVPNTRQAENESVPSKRVLRLIDYDRVSTDEQNDPDRTSIDNQSDKNCAYAESIGAIVVARFKEDYTGTELSRPELNKALRMLANNEADGIVCMRVDRLARSVAVFMTLWTVFTNTGKELHFSDNGKADMFKLDSLIITIMKASMSQEERKLIIGRMMDGKYKKLNNGEISQILGMTGKLPYGYRKIKYHDQFGNLIRKEVVINPTEAKIIRQMFLWAAYGYFDGNPMSTMQIARMLNTQNIALSEYQERGGFHPTTINRILHNPMYAGVFIYNRTQQEKKGMTATGNPSYKKTVRPKSEWYMFDLPSELQIIDIQTWNVVQNNIKNNKKNSKRNTKLPFLMAGHFRCGSCGRSMTSFHNFYYPSDRYKTHRATTKERYDYRRYQCTSKNLAKAKVPDNQKNHKMCPYPFKTVSAPKVEYMVWEWLKWLLSDAENIQSAIEHIREKSEVELSPKIMQLEATIDRMAEVEKTMSKLARRMGMEDDDYIYSTMKIQFDELKKENGELEKQRQELEEQVAGMEITETTVDEIWSLYDQIRDRLNDENITIENKRFVLDLFKVQAYFYYSEDEVTRLPQRWINVECVLGEDASQWFNVDDDADSFIDDDNDNGDDDDDGNKKPKPHFLKPKPSMSLLHNHLEDGFTVTYKNSKKLIHIEASLEISNEPIDVTAEFSALFSKSIKVVFIEKENKE